MGRSGGTGALRFLFSRRAHLLTTGPQARWWYCRDASDARSARRIALSSESARQCRRACEQRSPLPARRDRYTSSPSACENLHLAAFTQRQGESKMIALLSLLRKRNRKSKYGGDSNWQYTTWKRKSSAEARADPHAQHRPI